MLSAKYRFHGRRALAILFRQAHTVRSKSISLKYSANPRRRESRAAVVVGRKVSKIAPVRNRIRRRIYEVVRTHWTRMHPGFDVAFFVYDPEVATMPHAELEKTILGLLAEAGIIQ